MFPLCTKAGGQLFAFPDVCKVPAPPSPSPVPTPFPNIALCNQANGCAEKVKVMNQPALTISSEIPRTQGDEPGTAGGVTSGTNMDKAVFKQGVSKVKLAGSDAVSLLKSTAHNGASANAPAGMVAVPGQTKVFVNG
jgi:hypothetical protein